MSESIQVFADDRGILVLGDSAHIERFLADASLPSQPVESARLGSMLGVGAALVENLASAATESGRWVKLTKESAEAVRRYGLMASNSNGVSHAMIGKPGAIKQWIQIATTPGSAVANPAVLSGVAGIMAQVAMRQLVNEITDYLEAIDQKLDAVLQNQTNQVLARIDGVELALREAISVRDAVGRVSEVTWSKIQQSTVTVLETQAFALRQLDSIAERIDGLSKIDELAEVTERARSEVQLWLRVLVRCVSLHESIASIELDRVMDEAPAEIDRHLVGLRNAWATRREAFAVATFRILARIDDATGRANSKVLFNPMKSPAVVASCNDVASKVQRFHGLMEIESDLLVGEARRWRAAAEERVDAFRDVAADGLETVQRAGAGTLRQARSAKALLAAKLDERSRRRHGEDPDSEV